MTIAPPPKLSDLRYGHILRAGRGSSVVMADIDFETYSPAGFIFNPQTNKFHAPPGAIKKGLPTVGAIPYSEHPDAEVLSCAYDLKDGLGKRLWIPGYPNPIDLFNHILDNGLIEAWNVRFEYWIWKNVCVPKYGWPMPHLFQLRDAAAKARAFALPGSLEPAGNVLNIQNKKDKEGRRLLEKFSILRNPTKTDPRIRILPSEDPEDAQNLYRYNLRDIEAEAEISSQVPDLEGSELEFWFCDQAINNRGVQLDKEAIANCLSIVEAAHVKYNQELYSLTKGKVTAASEIQKLRAWMTTYGVHTPTLTAEDLTSLLGIEGLPLDVRRALEIREMIGSAAVKKLYSMTNQMSRTGRVHDLFIYHSARTGRTAGAGPQPQNFPNSGPMVSRCLGCKKHFNRELHNCPWCGCYSTRNQVEWDRSAMGDAFEVIASGNLECLEYYFGDAISTISGCLRGLFIAAPGHDLICSDYKAIEAVVLAVLAGEQWRIDVFNSHGRIYEQSASLITGVDFDEYVLYKATSGTYHPDRKLGKVAELASGYQGWIGAWKQFGADKFMNDEKIKTAVLAWRAASPAIVEMWGGQPNWKNSKYFGLEGAAIQAVLSPGREFNHRDIKYVMQGDILYCQLPSGRYLTYHRPRLAPSDRRPDELALSFEGWNTNPKNGPMGWIRMNTYGGKLTENCVQAVARDILAHAIVALEKRKYPVVLQVHDEIVSEIPEKEGSVEEFEEIMSSMPTWANNWPIKASGGWRFKRYGK